MATSSASLAATLAIDASAVLRPLREASKGLTSRRASYVVLCTMGTSRSPARSAESSLSAISSAGRRRNNAGVKGTVVGFAICVVHEATWSTTPTCYLEDLFVDPAARAVGVGRRLLADLVALGGERGWSSLYWHTRADNAQARTLYDRYVAADGFVRYRLAMGPNTTPLPHPSP